MKIWIDARDIFDDTYRNLFIKDFVKNIESDKENSYFVFLSNWESIETTLKKINVKYKKTFFENIAFWKYLSKTKLDKIITFDHLSPYFCDKKITTFSFWLDDLTFPNDVWVFNRRKNLLLAKLHYSKVDKIISFQKSDKLSISLKFWADNKKISVIKPNLFNFKNIDSKVDIKLRHNIVWDYIIVSWNNTKYENASKILKAFSSSEREDLSIIFIWKNYEKDKSLKDYTVSLWLKNRVFFQSYIKNEELWRYFSSSIWVIFFSSYDDVAFELSKALSFWVKILSTKSKFIDENFSKKPWFFSKNSISDLSDKIKNIEKSAKISTYIENKNFLDEFLSVLNWK